MSIYPSTINVTAVGQVSGVFDRCTFKVKTFVQESNTFKCKEAITPKIKEIDVIIKSLNCVSAGSHKASSDVETVQEYNSKTNLHDHKGYKYTHVVSFRINDVSRVNEIMDLLTSLDDVQMDSPVFSIKDDTELKSQAMKMAFDLARKNFEGQCKMAGVDSENYYLESWSIENGRFQNFTNSTPEIYSPMWDVKSLETPTAVKAGSANITVSVTLKFARKQ